MLWRRPRPKLGCGAKERRRKKKPKKEYGPVVRGLPFILEVPRSNLDRANGSAD
jgi:hypothetical protein